MHSLLARVNTSDLIKITDYFMDFYTLWNGRDERHFWKVLMHYTLGIDYTFNHYLTDFCFDLGRIIGLITELETQ